jgi:hypothetical protein
LQVARGCTVEGPIEVAATGVGAIASMMIVVFFKGKVKPRA